jgi:glycosyltransferase involved in cell wall biosynthesis
VVSVIVPAYGHEAFVTAALDSVAAQTHAALELIVIDDCSKDATFDRIRAWADAPGRAARFERLVVRRNEENLGAHGTLNLGLDLARGAYVSLLNSDDMYDPARLATLVATARRTGAEFLFSGVRVVDDTGLRLTGSELASRIEYMADYAGLFPSVSFALLDSNVAVSTGNFFFTRDLAWRVGPFSRLTYCHDWDFILRACLLTEPVLTPEPLYLYRVHGANTFVGLKREEVLEPEFLRHEFFQAGKLGHAVNPLAPVPSNWPGFFDFFACSREDSVGWAYDVAGGDQIRMGDLLRRLSEVGAV